MIKTFMQDRLNRKAFILASLILTAVLLTGIACIKSNDDSKKKGMLMLLLLSQRQTTSGFLITIPAGVAQ